ncbi:hypothetical protein CV102_07630 [Natronococcus pandeyae]|uniref:SPW repeat-containing integral membrane domain-containing protein n=1 Tax=Natronococcus pandeyae TaxID=2055836 RepID=A0A8J8Q7M3_9EURY|nr:hypothetical protein [Natronococcus pandeyae]TYL39149.1 hypothetical protein CV102_07630 [Natronococcus pandeyae]
MSDPNSDDRRTDTEADPPEGRTPTETDSGTGAGDRDDRGRDPRDDSTQIANEERRRNTPFISAIVAAIGVWVALSVLIYDMGAAALWNNVLVGAVVLVAGGYNYYRLVNDAPLSVGVASLVALLGIWLIVAPALLEMVNGFWSTLVSGLLIAALAGYNAYEAREARSVATEPEPEAP